MLQRRFGQILIVVLGAVGLLFGLANGAHAQSGVTSDESSATVSIQNNDSSSGVSVNQSHIASSTVGGVTQTVTAQTAPTTANVITDSNSNNSQPTASTDKATPGSTADSIKTSDTTTSPDGSVKPVVMSSNIDEGVSGPNATQAVASAPTMVLTKADGTTYTATKLVVSSGTSTIATPPATPASTSSSQQPAKPMLPMLPQGYVADAPMPVASAGRDSGGPLPLIAVPFASAGLVLILSLVLSSLLLIAGYLAQLRAQGYARAPRGATIFHSFDSLRSGFNMSRQLKLSPLFLNRELATDGWR